MVQITRTSSTLLKSNYSLGRLAGFLVESWFKVAYRPSKLNTKEDVLSRRRDHAGEEGSEAPPRGLFKPGRWVVGSARIASTKAYTLPGTIVDRLRAAGVEDLD